MRIGFFGDGPWAHLALAEIIADPLLEPAFICGRHSQHDDELKRIADSEGIAFSAPQAVNQEPFLSFARDSGCDVFASMSYDQIFQKDLLSIPPLGVINCHAGRLPFYRGRNVLNWVLVNDEKHFGVTVHYVDEGIDTGDIILQELLPIHDSDDYGTLLARATPACAKLLHRALGLIESGKVEVTPQSDLDPVGMYCVGRRLGDEVIDWNDSSRDVFNLVRAVAAPGPLASAYLRDEEVKIVRAEMVPGAPIYRGIPGSVVGKDGPWLTVKCLDSIVRVKILDDSLRVAVGDRFSCPRS